MFLGHALIAAALVLLIGDFRGWQPERSFALALSAAVFAMLPDADIALTLVHVMKSAVNGISLSAPLFWDLSSETHRTITHAPLVGFVAAIHFTLFHQIESRDTIQRYTRACLATGVLSLLSVLVYSTHGGLGLLTLVPFIVIGWVLTIVCSRRLSLTARDLGLTSSIGLVTHPLGDILSGTPPHFLYPLPLRLFDGRVLLSPDPTINLVLVFLVELLTGWIALVAILRSQKIAFTETRPFVSGFVGAAYGGGVFLMPFPSMSAPYLFSGTVLALCVTAIVVSVIREDWNETAFMHGLRLFSTVLLTMTLAALSYITMYIILTLF